MREKERFASKDERNEESVMKERRKEGRRMEKMHNNVRVRNERSKKDDNKNKTMKRKKERLA